MPGNGNKLSIWRGKNTVHIIKTGIEYMIALTSLAVAITTVLIATNVIVVPSLWCLLA
ncbi:hypothetical protein [Wolbachia endosymbiont of Brugia pahangi]|uniref:hypothetical protein n=1 Tax=Wolbachia endosymbiont of Brugia pahangi TaxID=96495 RepID=UPI001435CEAE|nr:hypothetical protein [Wolbachia endosymbiont of Brugia pahangi]QIT36569.1 hypothetical protein WBP_0033 [Wolbachia endosymbiont of Brugia pahangi]